jgi:phospholipid-binding lipoprotein MlaA
MEARVIRAIGRMSGYTGWAALVLLVLWSGEGSAGFAEETREAVDVRPLGSPNAFLLAAGASPGDGDGLQQDMRVAEQAVREAESAAAPENSGTRPQVDSAAGILVAQFISVTPGVCIQEVPPSVICPEDLLLGGEPAVAQPSPAPPPVVAEIKPSQAEGPGDLFRGPDAAQERDEPYDPFAKAEGTAEQIEEYDPWEPFNQAMFTFNRKLDEYVVKPVATVYDKVIPDPLEFGIRNAFHNVRFAPRFFNNLFQGKFKGAGIEAGSFLINSTIGVGGLFEPAKKVFGLETPDEDTGQTLGTYGAKPGPYLVLPFLGSFTLRDGIGFIGDLALDPFNWLVMPAIKLDGAPKLITKDDTILFGQLGMRAGYIVNERSINIETTFEGVEESVVDLYGAVRNAYLQKRLKAIKQ